ncbi:AtpZ/AtpI family protein [Arthrobacter castelli]|uniref:AtpZ/AtpI family protein n=1 Tax=Arthrobacter castelli TaxID=271431 RepID=UPI0005618B21|nr:AtpZ/AtpI family protein [Arthrobacter castelli]
MMAEPNHRRRRSSADESDLSNQGPYNAGLAVFSYIVGGIIVWTLIGWGLDNLLGTSWIVLAGAILGAAGGFYLAYAHGLTRHTATHGDSRSSDRTERPHQ